MPVAASAPTKARSGTVAGPQEQAGVQECRYRAERFAGPLENASVPYTQDFDSIVPASMPATLPLDPGPTVN